MVSSKQLRALLRSGSGSFAQDYADASLARPQLTGIGMVAWRSGDGRPVHYRRGTSDLGLIYAILFKKGRDSEYWLPESLAPRLILDIGGNIGVTARYLAHRFPQAEIHSFEPIPDNVALLRRNVERMSRAKIHPYGLGQAGGSFDLYQATGDAHNMGTYSAHAADRSGPSVHCEVRAVGPVLQDLGRVPIDLIKIDTEGAEYDILSVFPTNVLSQVSWICGELHAQSLDKPTAFRVLDLLPEWFVADVCKPLHKQNFFFDACDKTIAARHLDFRRVRSWARF